ncbi:MAG: sporulation protein YtfJ [Clostridium sp.]|nr:sporulation protein YtfJ [Clostridium sp.]
MSIEHPVDNLMKSTMENLKDMIDVNTVIGDTVQTQDGGCIIPISKVSFGFASGGTEFSNNNLNQEAKYPFGGGSGAGVSVKPIAFLVVKNDKIRLLPVNADNTYDRIVDTVPQVLDMVKDFLKKNKNSNEDKEDSVEQTQFDSSILSSELNHK